MGSLRRRARKFLRTVTCGGCTTADASPEESPSHTGEATSAAALAEKGWARPFDFVTKKPFEVDGPRRPHILPCGHSVSLESLQAAMKQPGERKCPQCGACLPPRAAEAFPVNYTVVAFIRDNEAAHPSLAAVPDTAHDCASAAPSGVCCATPPPAAHSSAAQPPAAPAATEGAPWWTPWGMVMAWWGGEQRPGEAAAAPPPPPPPLESSAAPKAGPCGAGQVPQCHACGYSRAAAARAPAAPRAVAAPQARVREAAPRQGRRAQEAQVDVRMDDVLTVMFMGIAVVAALAAVGGSLLRR